MAALQRRGSRVLADSDIDGIATDTVVSLASTREETPRQSQMGPAPFNKEQTMVRQLIIGSFMLLVLVCFASMARGGKAVSVQVTNIRERIIENDEVAFALHQHLNPKRQKRTPIDINDEGGSKGSKTIDGAARLSDETDPSQFDFSKFQQIYRPTKKSCPGNVSLVVASRYFGKTPSDYTRLEGFIKQTGRTCASVLLIAINIAEDRTQSYEKLIQISKAEEGNLLVVPVPVYPWGGISHALNLMIHFANQLHSTHILFQSPEIQSSEKHIDAMISSFEPDVLCVGGALKEHAQLECKNGDSVTSPDDISACSEWTLKGHEDIVQQSENAGLTSTIQGIAIPWNTFAMWDLKKLTQTGFMSLSDVQNPPGMEESATFAVQQSLFPSQSRIKLLHFQSPGMTLMWDQSWDSSERQSKHIKKMQSKNLRVQNQLNSLGVNSDNVHVEHYLA